MSKRYMDFVPAGSTRRVVREDSASQELVQKKVSKIPEVSSSNGRVAQKVNNSYDSTSRGFDQQFGVIEDLQPKFVKTDVKKRPLGRKASTTSQKEVKKEVKPIQKPGTRLMAKPIEKRVIGANVRPTTRSSAKTVGDTSSRKIDADAIFEDAVLKTEELFNDDKPKKKDNAVKRVPFVNTEKVEKRPLSGSVGRKKMIVAKEEPSKAVTIITKEKKDSKISVVVAVIITIILGATAGTVAFLLLPK